MTKIFITGSSTGLGALAAKRLIALGGAVYLHARNEQRKIAVLKENQAAKGVAIGDLSDPQQVKDIARQVNAVGRMDVVIENAGVDSSDSKLTARVNVEAPYILTALLKKPKRVIYIDSGMHRGAPLAINHLEESLSYASSKMALLVLTEYVACLWPDVAVNSIEPSWVPTRMGGPAANDDLEKGYAGQVWLATSNEPQALESGHCYYHLKLENYDRRANDPKLQERLIAKLADLTGVEIPK